MWLAIEENGAINRTTINIHTRLLFLLINLKRQLILFLVSLKIPNDS
jgi:hypothetical protein